MSTLALRRTVFLDGERRPDDYEVRHDGRTVGRIVAARRGALEKKCRRPSNQIRAPAPNVSGLIENFVGDIFFEGTACLRVDDLPVPLAPSTKRAISRTPRSRY